MPQIFECPEGQIVDDRFINWGYLRCGTNKQFVDVSEKYDMFSLLAAISDLDPKQVAMYTSIYLVFFITGVAAGLVGRQFKKT